MGDIVMSNIPIPLASSVISQTPINPNVSLASTIQITVVDEKGTKANCKLYRHEKLSDILKKYNTRIHTSYDSIMINNSQINLTKTPAQLGLDDGQVLQFCRTHLSVAAAAAATSGTNNGSTSNSPVSNSLIRSSTATSTTTSAMVGMNRDDSDTMRVDRLQQRITVLEEELANNTQKNDLLQNKLMAMENKLTEEQEKTQCRICFDKDRDTLIFPCLHFNYCGKCLEELSTRTRECPTCRGHISGVLRMQIG